MKFLYICGIIAPFLFGDYMSTDDCKKFIESVCGENSLKQNDKWKRVKKYKEGDLTLRDFQNTNGDVLVIAEDKHGDLSVYSIKKNIKLTSELKNKFSKENLILGLFKLAIDGTRESGCKRDFEDSFYTDKNNGGISLEAIEAYSDDNNDSLMKEDIKTYKVKPGDEIYCGFDVVSDLEEYGEKKDINFINDLTTEKIGVVYDKENVIFSYEEQEDMSYFMMQCGGDWEMPVIFFVYWSEKHNRLKGFFPTGEGNVYNKETNTAYGSEMEQCNLDWEDPKREKLEEKYGAMREKIDEDQEKNYEKAIKIGFKQFKDYLTKEYS